MLLGRKSLGKVVLPFCEVGGWAIGRLFDYLFFESFV